MSRVSGHVCPHCGAPLHTAKLGTVRCDFCGSTVTLSADASEPRQFGYEFERGRFDAQNSIPGAELAAEIRKLIDPLDDLQQTTTQLKELKAKVKKAETALKNGDSSNKLLMYILPVASFLFLIWLDASYLAALVVAVFIFGFYKLRNTGRKKNLEAAYRAYKEKLAVTADHLNEVYNSYNFDVVPEAYRQREPMLFFVKVLDSGRAASLQQAINLYEEEKHRRELLRLQQEQNAIKRQELEVQRQQLKDQKEFNKKKLELAQQKKGVDWGAVAAAAGSVAIAAATLKGKRK